MRHRTDRDLGAPSRVIWICTQSFCLPLVRNGSGGFRNRLRVAQVVVPQGLLLVKVVDQRYPGRDIQRDDVLFGDLVEVLDQRPQAVAVSGDDHFLAALDRRYDRLVPVGKKSRDRVLETFGQRELGRAQPLITRVAAGIARVGRSKAGGGTS